MRKLLAVSVVQVFALACVCSADLLTNGAFESPDTNEWTGSSWSGAGCSREKWAARSGKWGVAVPAWGGDPAATNQASVLQFVGSDITPGQTYTLSAWIKKESAVRDQSIQLQVRWWDAGWSSITTLTQSVNLPGDGRWHQVFMTCTASAPETAHATVALQVQWLLTNSPGGAAMTIDDAQFYTGTCTGSPFANGSFSYTNNTESGGFAGSQWNRTALLPSAGDPPLSMNDWANRSGSGFGAVFEGWNSGSAGAELSQNFYPSTGTYTFAVWINRQANFALSNAELRIGWYDATFTNRVQADTLQTLKISSVDGWHEYWVSGTCANPALREMRVSVAGQWGAVAGQANTLWIDDARVTAGTYIPSYAAAFTNGSFENPANTEDWNNTGWTSSGNARRTNWMARTGARGLVVESWAASQTAVFQDLASTGGTYTFSAWTQIQTNANPQSTRLILEWGGDGGTVVRTDVLSLNSVPQDGNWYRAFMTANCTNAGVKFVRPILFALYGSEKVSGGGANTIGFDDAEFYAGSLAVPSSFTNGGFENPSSTNLWSASGWTPVGSVSREDWAGRTSTWGGVVQGWLPGGSGAMYQDVAATGGTYTLSMWLLKQPGARATNMQLSLEWYNGTQWSPLQAQSAALNDSDVPADGRWHHVWVTSTYAANDALFLRSKLSCQFAAGEATENAIMLDDADLYRGSHVMPALSSVFRDGGFETPNTNWAETGWSRIAPVYLQDWAALEGHLGAVLPTWEGTNRGVLYQDVSVSPGTFTFSMWIRPQAATHLTNAVLALEWYSAAQFAPIQVDSRLASSVPADGHWHQVQITGTCNAGNLAFVRPVFAGQYAQGSAGENSIMLDQSEFYAGSYTGKQSFTNGSFAEGKRRWTISPDVAQIVAHTDWGGHSGSHLLAVEGWWGDNPSYTSSVAQTLVGVPAGTYRFSGWFKRDIDFSLQSARLRVKGYNADHVLLFNVVTNLTVVPNGQWTQFGVNVDCGAAGLAEVVPSIDLAWTKVNGSLQLDDLAFELQGPSGSDSDSDGIADAWEILHFGNLTGSGISSNFDGDAWTDWQEYVADTDPKNANSGFGFAAPGNPASLRVLIGPPTTNSRVYQVFWSSNLMTGSWSTYTPAAAGNNDGSAIEVLVTNSIPAGYYRARVSVP